MYSKYRNIYLQSQQVEYPFDRWVKRLGGFALTLLVLAFLTFDTNLTIAEEKAEVSQYCEMVRLHNQDNTVGWPDYKGTFETQCNF